MSWAYQPLLPSAQLLGNNPPTVVLNTPTDTQEVVDVNPELVFTGTDVDSDDIRYNIQVDQYGFNTHSLDLERSSSQYASIADASQTGLDITGDITLEAWIKLESSPASGEEYVIVSKNDYGTNNRGYGFSYFNQAGTPCLFAQISGDGTNTARNRVYANQTLSTGTWYHVAVAIDVSQAAATQFEFFLDGTSLGNGTVLENDGATSIYNNTAPFLIGCYFSSGAVSGEGTFDGLIDEVRVWNDLRTQTEISNNKNISSTYFTSGVNNFVDGWSMDNSYNSVSGSNNLTASGSPVFSTDTPFSPLINAVSGTDAGFSGTESVMDSYSESNWVDGTTPLSSNAAQWQGEAQSFTGKAKRLSKVQWYLKVGAGSPTGNAVAKVYAHSGTFGTSSVLTGAALATSDNFDVSTLDGTFGLKNFTFSGANKIVLSDATKYVATIEYSGGDSSNYIRVGSDYTSPTHAGNESSLQSGSWTAASGYDEIFYVYYDEPFTSGQAVTYTVQGQTTVDSYSESNKNYQNALYSGAITEAGQSITGNGRHVDLVDFYLQKVGSPTGNAVAKIYAHTGSFGGGGTPTGSVLATSNNVDVSTLGTSFSLVPFTFPTPLYLTNDTKYCVVVSYSGGDSSNKIEYGFDDTTPSHAGNLVEYNGSWAGWSSTDICFYLYSVDYTLANSTTYYWRVRAIDPSGSNSYGAWATTRSFTTEDALATLTKTFTVDGIVEGVQTKTFTIDGIVEVVQTATFTIDGIVGQISTSTFTIDGIIEGTQTSTFTVDGIVEGTQTNTFTIDGIVLVQQTSTFTIDGLILETKTSTFTIDGIVGATLDKTFTIDGLVKDTLTNTFTIDGYVALQTTKTFTIDGIVEVPDNTKTFTVDGLVKTTLTSTFTVDGVIQATQSSTFTIDGLVQVVQTNTFTIDGVVNSGGTLTFTIDGIVQTTQTSTFTVDGLVKTTLDNTFTIDGLVKDIFDETFTIDGIVLVQQTNTFTIDGIVRGVKTSTFTVDGIVKVSNSTSFNIDGLISIVLAHTFTIDGIVYEIKTKTFTVDGIIASRNNNQFTVDGVVLGTLDKTFTIDGRVILQVGETFIHNITIDGVVLGTQTQEFTLDGDIRQYEQASLERPLTGKIGRGISEGRSEMGIASRSRMGMWD